MGMPARAVVCKNLVSCRQLIQSLIDMLMPKLRQDNGVSERRHDQVSDLPGRCAVVVYHAILRIGLHHLVQQPRGTIAKWCDRWRAISRRGFDCKAVCQ
jgi:hypothetical protein